MTMPRQHREEGRGPQGSEGTASSPDNRRVPKNTPGPLAINDAFSNMVFRDLTVAQRDAIKAAIKLALRKIGEAKAVLVSAGNRPSERVMRYFKITGTTDADLKALDVVLENYNVIAGALLGHEKLVLDGEKTGPYFGIGKLLGHEVAAYVWGNKRPEPGEEGTVNIVTPEFSLRSLENKSRALIHEVSHKYAGTVDVKYLQGQGGGNLDTAEAIRNADTYAYFAIPDPRSPSLSNKRNNRNK